MMLHHPKEPTGGEAIGHAPALPRPESGADHVKGDDPASPAADAVVGTGMPAPPAHQRAPTTAPPTGPDLPRHAAGQIAQAILHHGPGQTEIRLDPAELGHVRLSLDSGDNSMTVTIHAARDDTAALLRRHADLLTQEFRAIGYREVTFSFGSGQQGQDQRPPPAPANVPATTLPSAPAAPPTGGNRPGTTGGLDLRI